MNLCGFLITGCGWYQPRFANKEDRRPLLKFYLRGGQGGIERVHSKPVNRGGASFLAASRPPPLLGTREHLIAVTVTPADQATVPYLHFFNGLLFVSGLACVEEASVLSSFHLERKNAIVGLSPIGGFSCVIEINSFGRRAFPLGSLSCLRKPSSRSALPLRARGQAALSERHSRLGEHKNGGVSPQGRTVVWGDQGRSVCVPKGSGCRRGPNH
jgi:hypothetical protein